MGNDDACHILLCQPLLAGLRQLLPGLHIHVFAVELCDLLYLQRKVPLQGQLCNGL